MNLFPSSFSLKTWEYPAPLADNSLLLIVPNRQGNWNIRLSCVSLFTHYFAESFSWYSLERAKHSCTPLSAQSLFIAARSSSENGSVSSILATTSITSLASTWRIPRSFQNQFLLKPPPSNTEKFPPPRELAAATARWSLSQEPIRLRLLSTHTLFHRVPLVLSPFSTLYHRRMSSAPHGRSQFSTTIIRGVISIKRFLNTRAAAPLSNR